ncbi:MAG: hypothetical protein IJ089_13655 [Clostridia bacterium]|nr:hypothetical protein [Clostridia bacterium]MBQ8964810.1 hypothetical protein [Clostridia bacterium]
MILDKNSQGYREEYDGAALNKMADMAKRYVAGDDGNRYVRDSIPDGSFSDFSCSVWEIMVNLVRYGKQLAQKEQEAAA